MNSRTRTRIQLFRYIYPVSGERLKTSDFEPLQIPSDGGRSAAIRSVRFNLLCWICHDNHRRRNLWTRRLRHATVALHSHRRLVGNLCNENSVFSVFFIYSLFSTCSRTECRQVGSIKRFSSIPLGDWELCLHFLMIYSFSGHFPKICF